MQEDTELYHNKWLSLKEIKSDLTKSYIYSHETRCDGKIVSILPYRRTAWGIDLLFRNEITPYWNNGKAVLSTITGGVETDNPKDDVIRELEEEAGYTVSFPIPLGTCYGAKSSDTVYYLYTVDLTGFTEPERIDGDGSKLEAAAYCLWKPNYAIIQCDDPLGSVMYVRMQKYF